MDTIKYDYEFDLKLLDKLKINNDVTVTLCRLGTKNTHFGIDAPRHITILRGELQDRNRKPNQSVATNKDKDIQSQQEIMIEKVILK